MWHREGTRVWHDEPVEQGTNVPAPVAPRVLGLPTGSISTTKTHRELEAERYAAMNDAANYAEREDEGRLDD